MICVQLGREEVTMINWIHKSKWQFLLTAYICRKVTLHGLIKKTNKLVKFFTNVLQEKLFFLQMLTEW